MPGHQQREGDGDDGDVNNDHGDDIHNLPGHQQREGNGDDVDGDDDHGDDIHNLPSTGLIHSFHYVFIFESFNNFCITILCDVM